MRLLKVAGIVWVFFYSGVSQAQLNGFNSERLKLDKGLMLTLGGWATGNLISGGMGWATTPNSNRNGMNVNFTFLNQKGHLI